MAVDDEELMMELQRVAVQVRRSRRAHVKNRAEDKEGNPRDEHEGHDGHGHCHHGNKALPDFDGDHSYGNHKCHGGSGRHGQNRILAALMMQDGVSQKDLAYLLGIRPQSLTQALETLEQDGFVERKQDDSDKRLSIVCLTDKGRGRATKVAEDRKAYAENAFSMLSAEEKEQLASILDKIDSSIAEDVAPR